MLANNETKPGSGIAPRKDLDKDPIPYGLIDCKISSLSTDKDNFFWMKSSPTTSQGRFPPFNWNSFPDLGEGMPREFNFDWEIVPIDVEKDSVKVHLQTQ